MKRLALAVAGLIPAAFVLNFLPLLAQRLPPPRMETVVGGKVSDFDGNEYETVRIGEQEWMVGNLRVIRLNDGTPISRMADAKRWSDLLTPAYAWYNDDVSHKQAGGALYNWHAVATGKLCPRGWRVPSDGEWQVLVDYLGGKGLAGGKLKSTTTVQGGRNLTDREWEDGEVEVTNGDRQTGRTDAGSQERAEFGWHHPNTGATNETGFSALSGGLKADYPTHHDGRTGFQNKGLYGYWWTASESSVRVAWYRLMYYNSGHVSRMAAGKSDGMSVCCIRE